MTVGHKELIDAGSMSAPHALASSLAALLQHMDLYTVTDFEEFLSDAGNVRYLVSCLRSDEFGGTLQETVAASVMSTARASAEVQLLGNELRAMELSMQPVATRRVRRAAKVQLLVHVGLPHPARRSVTAQTESVPKVRVATATTQVPTRSEAAKQQREEDQHQREQREQAREQAMAEMRPVLEQASAARRDAQRSLAAAQDLRNANHASYEKASLEAVGAAADRAEAARDRVEAEALRAKLTEAEDNVRMEAARADRATAKAAMLLKEIESIDVNELNECHNAMEGFWQMYLDEKGSSA